MLPSIRCLVEQFIETIQLKIVDLVHLDRRCVLPPRDTDSQMPRPWFEIDGTAIVQG